MTVKTKRLATYERTSWFQKHILFHDHDDDVLVDDVVDDEIGGVFELGQAHAHVSQPLSRLGMAVIELINMEFIKQVTQKYTEYCCNKRKCKI